MPLLHRRIKELEGEYVRADLYAEAQKEIDRLTKETSGPN